MNKIDYSYTLQARFLRCSHFRSLADERRYAMTNGYDLLLVITGGRMWSETGSRRIAAAAGDLVYHPAGVPYVEWTTPAAPTEGFKILFHWPGRPTRIPDCVPDRNGLVRALVSRMMAIWGRDGKFHVDAAHLLFAGVLGELLELVSEQVPDLVQRVRDYTREHLELAFSLAALAAHFGYNPSYFIRKFQAVAGQGPMAEVRRFRLEAAREQVLSTDLPVKAIAAATGFADASHLSRLFRQQFHVTIRELRSGMVSAAG